jgi:hypothetical protein
MNQIRAREAYLFVFGESRKGGLIIGDAVDSPTILPDLSDIENIYITIGKEGLELGLRCIVMGFIGKSPGHDETIAHEPIHITRKPNDL